MFPMPDESTQADDPVMLNSKLTIQIIDEGEEPENFFWAAFGGKPEDPQTISTLYDQNAPWHQHTRVFQCTNSDKFRIVEALSDFCQMDLSDDDIMLIDTSEIIFIWIGKKAIEIKMKFGVKSAQLYLANLKNLGQKRSLRFVKQGNEKRDFTRIFHGWRDWQMITK